MPSAQWAARIAVCRSQSGVGRVLRWGALAALVLVLGPAARAQGPPEARRLDAEEFRQGLRQRGLVELLEFALTESPPQDQAEADLLHREVLLAIHQDASQPAEKRAKAGDLAGAVALYERAVQLDPDLDLDPKAEAERLASSGDQ